MSDHVDTVLLTDEYLEAARELRQISQEKKVLAEREAAVKQTLEKLLTVGERGVSADGEELVAVRKGAARFKPELAAQALPENVLATVMVSVPDAKLAKAILSPALYEQCCEYNKASVVAL